MAAMRQMALLAAEAGEASRSGRVARTEAQEQRQAAVSLLPLDPPSYPPVATSSISLYAPQTSGSRLYLFLFTCVLHYLLF